MPREVITYPHHTEPDTGSASDPVVDPLVNYNEFELHWSRRDFDGYAQLSMSFNVKNMLDYLTQLQKDSPEDHRTAFYSDVLSRGELQTLIRVARRARDAVHGADE